MFKNMKTASKLILGFGVMIIIIVAIVMVNYYKLKQTELFHDRIVSLRVPTVNNSWLLRNGINSAMASLRGWVLMGKEESKKARSFAWSHEINPALDNLRKLSVYWTNPENVKRFLKIEELIIEFSGYQNEIEEITQAPENVPANKIMADEAGPVALRMTKSITEIIDLENLEPDIANRKFLLRIMADIRGSLGLALSNIKSYLLGGNLKFKNNFNDKWRENAIYSDELQKYRNLLTGRQGNAFDAFLSARLEFVDIINKVVKLRMLPDWDASNYLLSVKAAPIADKILYILNEMVENQQSLLVDDENKVTFLIQRLVFLQWILLLVGIIFGALFSFFITRSILKPIKEITRIIEKISAANFEAIPGLTTTAETSPLVDSIRKIGVKYYDVFTQLKEKNALITSIFRKSNEGMITVNEQGIIESFNKVAEQIFGHNSDEVNGKNLNILFPEKDKCKQNIAIVRYPDTGETKVICEGAKLVGVRKNGEQFPMSLAFEKIDLTGKIIFLGVFSEKTGSLLPEG